MTIAPCGAGMNAAQEPRPANGASGTPSTVTFTSSRGKAIRTTPSGAVVALVPAAAAILSASNVYPAALVSARPDRPESSQAEIMTVASDAMVQSPRIDVFIFATPDFPGEVS